MRILCLLLLLVGCSGAKQEALEYFAIQTPRPFGYVIGDEISQRIIIETLPGITLQTTSLPKPGQLKRWLNLNQVNIQQQGQRFEIELRYQIFYAALEVKALKLPSFNLALSDAGLVIQKEVPAWEFTVSPLRELSVRKTEHGEYMRPDAQTSFISSAQATLGLALSTLVASGLGIYLLYLYGYLPMLWRRRLFKQALQQLAKLSTQQMGQALTVVHHAFNRLNRQPLFQKHTADFYQQFPQYQAVSAELDWFFQYSNRYFFSEDGLVDAQDFEKLKALCRHCRQIERGSR